MIISSIIFVYFITFLAIFVQVFFLVTFLERKREIIRREEKIELGVYPSVTIVVPCWNEENTIQRTVLSLLDLDYPKEKLQLFLIDDGSTDNTLKVLKEFETYSNIKVFHKENGGKHTAVNLGLENNANDFFGCLDADSFVHPEALKRIITYFDNPEVMAVAPSIIIHKPKNFVQYAQKAEYEMAVYIKKMLGFLDAIHVTPGPFSIFRKTVFDKIGNYRKAHNTEDMEIAYRMQSHRYKIEQCNDAYVYTVAPDTIKKLFKQRVRWIYGFINNTLDYKRLILRPKYGNFALFTIPSGVISISAALYLFTDNVGNIFNKGIEKFTQASVTGLDFGFNLPHLNWFYMNTETSAILTIILFSLLIISMILGSQMANGRVRFSLNIFYFIAIYSIVAPFWLLKAVYNTVFSKTPSWR